MKTLNEIYTEVMASDELKAKFAELRSADEAVAFVKELGGDAEADEIAAFLKEESTKTGELYEAELQQVAGGKGVDIFEAVNSAITLGIYCAVAVLDSLTGGNVGTGIEGDRMLCDKD